MILVAKNADWELQDLKETERLDLQLIVMYQISSLEHRIASVEPKSIVFPEAEIQRWKDQLIRLKGYEAVLTPQE